LDEGRLIRVIRGASEDPEAYAVMRIAENRKFEEELRDLPPGADSVQQDAAIRRGAAARGVYDAIREDVGYDKRDDENDKREWTAKVVKGVVSIGIGLSGPGGEAVGAVGEPCWTSRASSS